MTEENLENFTINYLSEEQYNQAKENNELDENQLYMTEDDTQSDKIIESGKNENGNYIKYSTGDLIVRQWINLNNIAINSSWGNLYFSEPISFKNYPIPFVGTLPNIALHCTSATSCWIINNSQDTNAKPGDVRLCRPTQATMNEGYLSVIAIGKWK